MPAILDVKKKNLEGKKKLRVPCINKKKKKERKRKKKTCIDTPIFFYWHIVFFVWTCF